jgi:AraC family transcriptional regulator
MDSLENMNKALAYIEENLDNELDMTEVTTIARCSELHFKKMFFYLSGITLLEYIRRRRLTMAGLELKDQNMKVIDAAVKYGYHSPDSFSRAFYHLHGINPSEASKKGTSLKAFPRMTFQLTIRGENAMDYRIEEKNTFTIVGIKERILYVYNGENSAITEMEKLLTDEVYNKLKNLGDVKPYGRYEASFNFTEEENEEHAELDYLIGVATTKKDLLGFDYYHVPALTWVIFTINGNLPDVIEDAWGRIYSEWLPSSHYQVIEGPDILFIENENSEDPNYKSEIWIPVG